MADFWPPRPSRFWRKALSPLRRFYLRRFYAVSEVAVEGMEQLQAIPEGDGIMLAPNHSHDSDPHVMMELGRRLRRQLYFMAAWQIFRGHRGLDGFVLQRMGAFSVDREGCDRRALKKAIELLSSGRTLVVFPEGEIYHTNDRLTPLREGVAFMASSASRDLEKESPGRKVWIVPVAIRYRYVKDVSAKLEEAVSALEGRLKLRKSRQEGLARRIVRVGESLLMIQEQQILGRAGEGALAGRIRTLVNTLLERQERTWLDKPEPEQSVAVRVKTLRQAMLARWADPAQDARTIAAARDALAEVQLAMQLYSYPGDYLMENPTLERMAETIEKFEEDVYDKPSRPKGKRSARVRIGEPMEVAAMSAGLRPRTAATRLTAELEDRIRGLMRG